MAMAMAMVIPVVRAGGKHTSYGNCEGVGNGECKEKEGRGEARLYENGA